MTTVIGFTFPAGRYHATPWGSHVNEADVEWPPSPWRVLRALIAIWHRKLDPDDFPEGVLERLIDALSEVHPYYQLPTMVHTHSRHYMPERSGKGERRVLVFDAFGRLDFEDELLMIWPDVELQSRDRDFLSGLLRALGYLGRAESWVDARLVDEWDGSFDCSPMSRGEDLSPGDEDGEAIRLPSPVPPEEYARWRADKVAELGLHGGRLNKSQQGLLATLPERLLDALRLESADIRKEGWSRPPGMEYVLYRRPLASVQPRRGRTRVTVRVERPVTTARLVLSGKPLPRLEDAVRVAELVRYAAIRKADDVTEEPGDVPSVLSGHDMGEDNRHEHAFYLPEDDDGDGRLDHVLIHADAGFDVQSLVALDRIRRIWEDESTEWRVALEGYGSTDAFRAHPYLGPSRSWVSVTPYLHPWYRKKKFEIPDQILRECEIRGLAEPVVEELNGISVRGRQLRPVHFRRFRRKHGLRQPDTRGSFWRLTFSEPVQGPLALGFACHFGLGVFRVDAGSPWLSPQV